MKFGIFAGVFAGLAVYCLSASWISKLNPLSLLLRKKGGNASGFSGTKQVPAEAHHCIHWGRTRDGMSEPITVNRRKSHR